MYRRPLHPSHGRAFSVGCLFLFVCFLSAVCCLLLLLQQNLMPDTIPQYQIPDPQTPDPKCVIDLTGVECIDLTRDDTQLPN